MKILLLSNSTNFGCSYLQHCEQEIKTFFGNHVKKVAFVPYALRDHDGYARIAREKFESMGFETTSLHEAENIDELLNSVQALFIGGGNTFRLLKKLHEDNLITKIRKRVLEGMIYMGASAGTNVATPNIKTTNDMPIVFPGTFESLGLVPFNINPHFIETDKNSTHMGETREKRIEEFLEENKNVVVGLREGAWLKVEDNTMKLMGHTAKVFYPDGTKQEVSVETDLSPLLTKSLR